MPTVPSRFSALYERPLPHSPEAEMALIGSAILDPRVFPDVALLIGAGDFYGEAHGTLWRALDRAYAADPERDMVDLQADLAARGELQGVGGSDYLAKLANETPSAAGALRYAKIVAEKARLRRLIGACDKAVYDALHEADADEVCSGALEAVSQAVAATGASTEVTLYDAETAAIAALDAREVARWPIGIREFDREFGGIPKVGVTTMLGVPSSGKSSLVANIVQRTATGAGVGWRVFSFEMPGQDIGENILQADSGVSISTCRNRREWPLEHERQRIAEVHEAHRGLNIAFVEDLLTPPQIYARCAVAARKGVGGFVIDYAQNVARSFSGQSEPDLIAEVMRTAQTIMRRFRCAVIVVSQPTLAACREDRPLNAADGKGGQDIYAAADMMISVYRSAALRGRGETEGEQEWEIRRKCAELHVVKNKRGRVGMVPVEFTPELTRFG